MRGPERVVTGGGMGNTAGTFERVSHDGITIMNVGTVGRALVRLPKGWKLIAATVNCRQFSPAPIGLIVSPSETTFEIWTSDTTGVTANNLFSFTFVAMAPK